MKKRELRKPLNEETIEMIKEIKARRKEAMENVDFKEYLKDFEYPEHSKKCRTCYGLGRIGYAWDPKTKTRGDAVICPKYLEEIKIAVAKHAIHKKAEEDKIKAKEKNE